jgi:hypothetical protein
VQETSEFFAAVFKREIIITASGASVKAQIEGIDICTAIWYNRVTVEQRFADSVVASSNVEVVARAAGAP